MSIRLLCRRVRWSARPCRFCLRRSRAPLNIHWRHLPSRLQKIMGIVVLLLQASQPRSPRPFRSRHRGSDEADVVKARFEQYVKNQLSLKPFKHDLGRALTWHTMQHLQDECFACEEIKDFHNFQDKFDDAVEVALAPSFP